MGIILQEPYNTRYGFVIQTGVYITVSNSTLNAMKNHEGKYEYHCMFCVYDSLDSKNNGRQALDMIVVRKVEDEVYVGNIYTLLYDELKTRFTSYIDN